MGENHEVHIELSGISKSFGCARALRDVSVTIRRGTVHALVGENGAGKSTLSRILAGVFRPDEGELRVSGRPVIFGSPRQALGDGIALMEQELALLPHRTVIDNVYLGHEPRRWGVVRRRELEERYAKLRDDAGYELDGNALVGSLRLADQQKVEIMRALARNAELIIMDEPTAPLNLIESEQLHKIVRRLRARGTTIVYISHFLDEVLDIADTVTAMRDGRHVQTGPASDQTEATLVSAMLGRELELGFPPLPAAPERAERPVLEVRQLTSQRRFRDVSFSVAPGEIVGMAGLVGSGRTEIARAISGADPVDSGEVWVDGKRLKSKSPNAAIRQGIIMLPESRQHEGLVLQRSIEENITLANLGAISTGGVIRKSAARSLVLGAMSKLNVKAESARAPVNSLSGGNQQKVVFAKCLMVSPRLLIVDEPTRGVDVGAKRAIYELLGGLAAEGMGVLVISSELEEVLGLAHRVIVIRRGRVAADLVGTEATEERVLAAAFGSSSPPNVG